MVLLVVRKNEEEPDKPENRRIERENTMKNHMLMQQMAGDEVSGGGSDTSSVSASPGTAANTNLVTAAPAAAPASPAISAPVQSVPVAAKATGGVRKGPKAKAGPALARKAAKVAKTRDPKKPLFRKNTLCGKLYEAGRHKYMPKNELLNLVSKQTHKTMIKVGYALGWMTKPGHQTNKGRVRVIQNPRKEVKIVAV